MPPSSYAKVFFFYILAEKKIITTLASVVQTSYFGSLFGGLWGIRPF